MKIFGHYNFFIDSLKNIMVGIVSGVVSGIVVGGCLWIVADRIETHRQNNLDAIRTKISGTWQFVIKSENTWLVDIVSISSDADLNISGVSIRYAEKTEDKELLEYSNENISKHQLSGTIVKDSVTLNGNDNLNNLNFYDLTLDATTNDYLITGTYFQNVADQYGRLCGRKIKGPEKLISLKRLDTNKSIILGNKTMGDQIERLIKDCSN